MRPWILLLALAALPLASCGSGPSYGRGGSPNMGGPTEEVRRAEIAAEPTGNFFYGRRYFVYKTRFWGYLREPRQNPRRSKLVIMNEKRKLTADRLPEHGPAGARHGFDQNYEYRIWGNYSGRTLYDPNSNQFLPEFVLSNYEVVKRKPGWLFSPQDHYNERMITLLP